MGLQLWVHVFLAVLLADLLWGDVAEKSCDPESVYRIHDPKDHSAYFQCLEGGRLEKFVCPAFYRQRKIYDRVEKNCVVPSGALDRKKRQLPSSSGSQTVGQFCSYNTDCTQGAYCNNGICECWSTHTNINNYCWRKINPDESGCQYDTQCSSVWPGAYCNSASVCRCPFARPPAQTRDGPVCYVPGECPTNSQYPKLRDPGTEVISTCQTTTVAPYFLIGCSIWFDVYDCYQNEYCCPVRAMACIQQMAEGTTSPGTSTSTRYYYNSVSRSCLTFTFLGAEGNANNFLTLDQCESYCLNQCERGAPEYDTTTAVGASGNRIRYCSTNGGITSSTCGSNFQCDRVQSLQICCPRPTFVCGLFGGVQRSTVPSQPYSSGTTRGTNSPITRWYWDTSLGRCTTFSYGGYGGNYNNFLSQSDCESYCSKSLCTQGEPLRDNSGLSNFACSSSSACPTTHTCTNSVCCPTVQTVCNQPQAPGANCNSPTTRYWFNSATGVCEQFQYNGCQGNANNFEDSRTCNDYCAQIAGEPRCVQGKALKDGNNNFYQCALTTGTVGGTAVIQNCPSGYECYFDGNLYGCCPTPTFTCQRPADSGTACNPSTSTRWYFDVTTSTCRSFQYFGCDGNSNNFATQRDCEDYCGATGCPDGGDPYRELGGQTRVCSSTNACPTTHTCQPVTLTQSGTTIATTTSYCCPRKSTICALVRDQGSNCGNTISRYFYNPNTRTCEVFTYFGCAGNANNFPTLQSCLNFCNSAACDTGELAYLDPVTNNIQICRPGVINSCPSGYSCTYDTLGGQNVCCGAGDLGVCPNGQRSFVDALTGSARQCTPNIVGNCPGNYLCVFNPNRRLYYCCGSRGSSVCPNNAQAYTDPTTNQPRACTLNAVNVCPAGFSCQSTAVSGQLYGYCCSGSVGNTVCGTGGVYTVNAQAVRCTLNVINQCPAPYTCRLSSSGDGVYYCCSDTATNVCPNNGGTYLVNGQPQQCSVTNTLSGCPSSFSCVQSANGNGLYYCCSGSQYSAYCGDATPYLIGGTTPQQCYPGTGTTCPSNYICELSTALNTYYCCTGSGCPTGYEAYLVGTVTQYCTPGIVNACPAGYSCLLSSTTGRNQCCRLRQTTTGCLNGAQSYINPATGQPQLCVLNQINSCPAGYTCQLGAGNQNVCCQGGGTNVGTCPNGLSTYISPSTGRAQSCVLNQVNTCPVGYTCQQGTVAGRYLCCQTTVNLGTCPTGQTTYVSPTTGRAQSCQLGTVNNCPAGYTCQLGTANQYLCCRNTLANLGTCLNGLTTYISPSTGRAVACQSGVNTCPSGNTCQRGSTGQLLCCGSGQTQATRCSNGVSPYISPLNNQVIICAPNSVASGCPSGYICLRATNGQYVCCPGTTTSCPTGTTAYINPTTRVAQVCTLGVASTCPTGYTCTRAGTQTICCTAGTQQNNVCPTGRTPYINAATRQPRVCTAGVSFTGCTPGYSCVLGPTGGYYCCSGGGTGRNSGCPAGTQTYNQPGTNSPLVCSFSGNSACPAGYSCQYSTVYFQYICCQSRIFSSARNKADESDKKANEASVFVAADSPGNEEDEYEICDENHVLSQDTTRCLKRMVPGEKGCTETVQCKDFGVCARNRCRCEGGRVVHEAACVLKCPVSPSVYQNVSGFCEEGKKSSPATLDLSGS